MPKKHKVCLKCKKKYSAVNRTRIGSSENVRYTFFHLDESGFVVICDLARKERPE